MTTENVIETKPKRPILTLKFSLEKNFGDAPMKVRKKGRGKFAEANARWDRETEALAVSMAPQTQTEPKTLAASTAPQKRNVANTVSPNAKAFMESRWKR